MKRCTRCGERKALSEFNKDASHTDGLASRCRPCRRLVDRDRYHNTPGLKHRYMLVRFGLTPEGYKALLDTQGGVCAICRKLCKTWKRLAVDHDHACCPGNARSCGKCVRGLLCANRNAGIGNLGDDPVRLLKAVEYLRRPLGDDVDIRSTDL